MAKVPEYPILQSKEKVQITQGANLQEATEKFAESKNFLSNIGANVAQLSSNALAAQLGQQSGKNPQGDLLPSFTQFDQNFEKSYTTQAHATLSIEADKLITDINLQLAKAPKMTPQLIAGAQSQIGKGLQRIYSFAPSIIRPQLEKTFNDAQLSQTEQLTKRMIGEQHEERRNNTILANNKNAELAHSLAASGKYDAAEALVKSTKAINDSAAAANIGFTPQQGKVGSDTVRQAAINGRLQYEYDQAALEKKGDEYLKKLAKRPEWISDKDYPDAMSTLLTHVRQQVALKSNFEDLTITNFKTRMAENIGSITGTELQSTLDQLSPTNAAKLNLAYQTALHSHRKDSADVSNLNEHWEDPRAHAESSEKVINKAFSDKVHYVMNNTPNISREKAENMVAASAGSDVPVYTKILKNGLWSGDAASMVATARQIADLQQTGAGKALQGLNEQDLALASDITHNFNPADPAAAARMITENKQNQDPTVRKLSEQAFANLLFDNTRKNNQTTDDYVLKTFGLQGGVFHTGFSSPWDKAAYASDILSNWRNNFINSGRDNARAEDLTKEYIKNNYGKTQINGASQWTLHPIEKACGFSEGDGIPSIHKDIVRQLSEPLSKMKENYDNNISDEYWTIEHNFHEKEKPTSTTKLANVIKSQKSELFFVRHVRNGVSTDTAKYPLRLVGNNFNWDLNVQTNHGPRSIFLEAPTLGVHTYTPDLEWISEDYLGKNHYKNSLAQKYVPKANELLNANKGEQNG